MIARSEFLKNLLLLLGTFLVLIVSAEIVVRVVEHLTQGAQPRLDRPPLFYLHETMKDNRNVDYPKEKPENTFRIIVIGDSFTYGGKVQFFDTFPKRLERMLNLNVQQPRVEVLNWGYPGYSTAQELRGVKIALKHFNPDLIILAVTPNDAEAKPWHATSDYQDEQGRVRLTNMIIGHWHGLGLLLRRYYNALTHREYVNYHLNLFKSPETRGKFDEALQKIGDHCRRSNVPLVAVVFPFFDYPIDDRNPLLPIHKEIHDSLSRYQIPDLDLFDNFRGIPVYRIQAKEGIDSHPNETGHRIAAEAIYEYLAANNFLPSTVMIKNVKRSRPERKNAYPEVNAE